MEPYPFETLDDILGPNLRVVLVGINPSTYAVQQGHYFARKTNRFWPAFSRSRLSEPARRGLGVEVLGPEHDVEMPRFGIGFTDVVKVPSGMSTALEPVDYEEWTPHLLQRLSAVSPQVACFHGLTAFRPFVKWGLGGDARGCALGPQAFTFSGIRLYAVPNPSPANAHFTLEDQVGWYDRLADFVEEGRQV